MPLIAAPSGRVVVLTVTVTDSAGHATEEAREVTIRSAARRTPRTSR